MIELRDVYQKFAPQSELLFEGLNCQISKGEFVIVSGPSGSGKSTLLKMIAGEKIPSRGKVLVKSADTKRIASLEKPFFRRQFGLINLDAELILDKSVLENVGLALALRGASSKEITNKSQDTLQRCGLSQKARTLCKHLSGFEQQLVCVARALVAQPLIVLCDAPFGGLDEEESRIIIDLLSSARSYGATIIATTKQPELFSKRQRRHLTIENRKLHEFAVTKYPSVPC